MAGVSGRKKSGNCSHLLGRYCVPGSVLSFLHAVSHLIPAPSLLTLLLPPFGRRGHQNLEVKNTNSGHPSSTDYVSDTDRSISHTLTHFVLTTMLCSKHQYYFPYRSGKRGSGFVIPTSLPSRVLGVWHPSRLLTASETTCGRVLRLRVGPEV